MLSVTIDTSVYVSALNSRGAGSRLLGMGRAGQIRIDISDAILSETTRVLREKFAWDGHRLHDLVLRLCQITNRVTPTRALQVIAEDPSDDRILKCAIEARSQYIVTWDKDPARD